MNTSNGVAIRVESLSKSFRIPNIPKQATIKDVVVRRMRHEGRTGIVDALKDVSFTLEHGGVLGIVGGNGSGKTTLMRVMAGVCHADAGRVVIDGTIAPLLAVGAGFHPDLTGRENAKFGLLTMGLSRTEVAEHLEPAIAFAEIEEFGDLPARTYSAGMLFRLAFAIAVCVDPDVLLLDEVLSVGDERYAKKCLDRIDSFKRRGKTIVVVTHELRFVEEWCTTGIWLHEGRVVAAGEPREVVAAYRALAAASS